MKPATTPWLETALSALADTGDDGRAVVDFLQSKGTKIGFGKFSRSMSARATLDGGIEFNLAHFSEDFSASHPRILSLLAHESRHVAQGFFTALSIYGELDAWQVEFRLYARLSGKPMHPLAAQIVEIPLVMEREPLRRARQLMQEYAGKGYPAWALPLYPIPREVGYWVSWLLGRVK